MRKKTRTPETEMVEKILRNIPESRNSDICLMIEVWCRYFPQKVRTGAAGERGIWLRDLYDLPREDNVKRIRARFNREGKYYPTDWEVAKARGIKEDEWREILGYPSKEDTKNPSNSESYMDPERDFSAKPPVEQRLPYKN